MNGKTCTHEYFRSRHSIHWRIDMSTIVSHKHKNWAIESPGQQWNRSYIGHILDFNRLQWHIAILRTALNKIWREENKVIHDFSTKFKTICRHREAKARSAKLHTKSAQICILSNYHTTAVNVQNDVKLHRSVGSGLQPRWTKQT